MPSTVLIQGESGTGKEVIARAVHLSGSRAGKPFVAVSCAALAETLLESELFGYERGAFTGASHRRSGKFELAEDGTIFLDEIGDISPKLQVDLLRVLQERSFYRVGGSKEIEVHARVIAATNVDLESAMLDGRFREDLFYRLNVINISVPPLRDRREDIPLLVDHFLPRIALELGKEVEDVSQEGMRLLMAHDWPGNVRELENVLERAVVSAQDPTLTVQDLAFLKRRENGLSEWSIPMDVSLREVEQKVIELTLRRTDGNIKEAAAVLGIDRSTLYDKISRYGIERPPAHAG
jgi:transcriptional regulator with PAS, ATPase and Fis domain